MKRSYTMDEISKTFNGLEKQAEARNDLYDRVARHTGPFDKTGMSADDVAAYGVDKLGLNPPEGCDKTAFLHGYLTGHAHAKNGGGTGMDAAGGNWFAKQSHATRG